MFRISEKEWHWPQRYLKGFFFSTGCYRPYMGDSNSRRETGRGPQTRSGASELTCFLKPIFHPLIVLWRLYKIIRGSLSFVRGFTFFFRKIKKFCISRVTGDFFGTFSKNSGSKTSPQKIEVAIGHIWPIRIVDSQKSEKRQPYKIIKILAE